MQGRKDVAVLPAWVEPDPDASATAATEPSASQQSQRSALEWDAICAVCGDGGDLVACDDCRVWVHTSKHGTACYGIYSELSEAAEWLCQSCEWRRAQSSDPGIPPCVLCPNVGIQYGILVKVPESVRKSVHRQLPRDSFCKIATCRDSWVHVSCALYINGLWCEWRHRDVSITDPLTGRTKRVAQWLGGGEVHDSEINNEVTLIAPAGARLGQ
jgi:hypothetical protein